MNLLKVCDKGTLGTTNNFTTITKLHNGTEGIVQYL